MMTALTSISKPEAEIVPLARSTDAIGSVLRQAFGEADLPDDMARLLRRLDRHPARH